MRLEQKIGQLMMVGFEGTSKEDPAVQALIPSIEDGSIGGLVAFGYNVESPDQIRALNQFFQAHAPAGHPLLVGVDQEGGRVQRLSPKNGHQAYFSAEEVSRRLTPLEAEHYYASLAQEVSAAGFNVTLGPVVDLALGCPVIQGLGRSYGVSPHVVKDYALAFIKAHHRQGILTSLKHFPGHGRAGGDSHKGMVDITTTWIAQESEPFYALIQEGVVDTIMVGHLTHRERDAVFPATLSPHFVVPLLRQKGFDGVVISDDLQMGALLPFYTLEETVIRALQAGIDLLVFSKNRGASGAFHDQQKAQDLRRFPQMVCRALEQGHLSEEQVTQSYHRIKRLKERLCNFL